MNRYSDLMSPSVQADPYGLYEILRANSPIYRMPNTGFILITSFDLCREIMMKPDVFQSGVSPMLINPDGVPEEIATIYERDGWLPKASCSTSDPPRHTWVRSLLSKLFTAAKVRSISDHIESLANDLIKEIEYSGGCDFVESVAQPFPMLVIAKLIGVNPNDIGKFKLWSDAIVDLFSMMADRERQIECAKLIVEMQHYFKSEIESRRNCPTDDYLTILANSRTDEGDVIPMDELLSIITIDLLASGNETTTAGMASGVLMLAQNVNLQNDLRKSRNLIPKFVEEVLRLECPAQGMFRQVTEDIVIGGHQFRVGDILSLRFGAANRDEKTFSSPERINLERSKPGRHLAFGVGRHSCVGAPLARQELIKGFEVVIDRLEDIRLTDSQWVPQYVPSFFGRNLRKLPISYDRNSE